MTTPHSPNIRIGDREREDAINALGEHYSAGRLDIDEYGERTAKVTAARVRADLHALFTDLPKPHPTLSPPSPPTPPPAVDPVAPSAPSQFRRRQVASATVGLVWLAAIALMFLLRNHYVIFIPLALTVLVGAYWGNDRRDQRRRRRYRG